MVNPTVLLALLEKIEGWFFKVKWSHGSPGYEFIQHADVLVPYLGEGHAMKENTRDICSQMFITEKNPIKLF